MCINSKYLYTLDVAAEQQAKAKIVIKYFIVF